MISYNDINLIKNITQFQIEEFKNVRREPPSQEDFEINEKKNLGKEKCP